MARIPPTLFARHLRKQSTDTEVYLWRYLRDRRMVGVKFRRQRPIGSYIVDFVCLERKLVIEVDGGQHAVDMEYDQRRDEYLRDEGYVVLRFWDNEVFRNIEGVLERIKSAIRPHPNPLPEREKEIKEQGQLRGSPQPCFPHFQRE
jgi:very-short-patch-repair endonuclease